MPQDVRFGIRSRRRPAWTRRRTRRRRRAGLGPADVPSGQNGSFVLRFMSAQ